VRPTLPSFSTPKSVLTRDRSRLPSDFSKPIQIDLPISSAGAFSFWIEYDDEHNNRVKGREGYFNIDPVLRVKKRSPILSPKNQIQSVANGGKIHETETVALSLDGLTILTLVSKWMGPISDWQPHFAEARQRGYNMIHYTPLQQRGESLSPYSIADQMAFDTDLFEANWKGSKDEGTTRVLKLLQNAREEHGLLSLTDVVLNHTANNSKWLEHHPEAGYSVLNAPHLAPALEIDDAMMEFSASLASHGLPTTIKSAEDIDLLVNEFEKALNARNLWQYYTLDIETQKKNVEAALKSNKVGEWTGPDIVGKSVAEIANILIQAGKLEKISAFEKRFCVTVDPGLAAAVVKKAFSDLTSTTALVEAWGRVCDVLNVNRYAEWKEDTKIALDHIRNRVRYTRLDEHGPKLGPITKA
jgi:glycogen debranching enzyme